MTKSMTAYGRATSSDLQGLTYAIEIHSVNRRMLDVNLHLPKELLFLDMQLRRRLGKSLSRGQVTVKILFKKKKGEAASLTLLKTLKEQWQQLAKSLDYDPKSVDFSFLLEQADRMSLEEVGLSEENLSTEITKTFEKALSEVLTMKEVEGEALAKDVLKRLGMLAELTDQVEALSEKGPEKVREKLLSRLESVLEGAEEDERVLREIALYAEKLDITEELTRLRSHLQQARDLLSSNEKSVGRSLDFLTQEILRELNTIGSKSSDLSITKHILAAKAELEKIREQVQNIE